MAGWTNKPTTSGGDIQAYEWLAEFDWSITYKHRAIGAMHYPQGQRANWGGGTITSISQNSDGSWTITDSGANWVSTNPDCTGPRYFQYTCDPKFNYLPKLYDCIIEGDVNDERKQYRAKIIGNDTAKTIKIENTLDDYVTANLLSSVSSLVGKKIYFIKRGGLWWHDRRLQWPNDQELAKGVAASSTTTTLTISTLPQVGQDVTPWTENQFAGRDLLIYAGGKLVRRSITSNTIDTLTFPAMPTAPGGNYIILASGGRGFPGRQPGYPYEWYAGASRNVWGHDPGDNLVGIKSPATTLTWSSGSTGAYGLICETVTRFNILDNDIWSDVTEECSEADDPKSPNLFRTIRARQVEIMNLLPNFIEKKSYQDALSIPKFTIAKAFHKCGINSGASTVSGTLNTQNPDDPNDDTLDGATFSVNPIYNGFSVFYTIIGEDGSNLENGTGAVVDGVVTLGQRNYKTHNGRQVVYTAGFTRWYPLLIGHMRERTAFVADWEMKGDPIPEKVIYDPPTVASFCCEDQDPAPLICCKDCFGVGMYITRMPDGTLLVFGDDGLAASGGEPQPGDCARYVGENLSDSAAWLSEEIEDNGQSVELKYFDRMFEGNHPQKPWGTKQDQQRVDRIIKATSGTSRSITDTTKSWWSDWFGGGQFKLHTGTLIAGGSSSVTIDPLYLFGSDDERHCYFTSRFNGKPVFADFIFEVVHGGITHKMPITSVVGGVVNFASVGVTFDAGDQWSIREAPKINRYRGLEVELVNPADGSKHRVEITHSDNDTLYFANQSFVVEADWTGRILEPETGGVWMFSTSKPSQAEIDAGIQYQKVGPNKYWVQAHGSDPRGQDWHDDMNENEPHHRKAYGLMRKGDDVSGWLFDEMKLLLDVMRWTLGGVGWTNDPDGPGGSAPIPNHVEAYAMDASDGQTGDVQHPALVASIQFQINGGIDPKEGDYWPPMEPTLRTGPPFIYMRSMSAPTASNIVYEQQAAAAEVTAPNLLARAITVLSYGIIAGGDPEEVDTVYETYYYDGNGKTYIGEQHSNQHYHAPADMNIKWRKYSEIADFAASTTPTQYSEMFNYPLDAIEPEENPGYWGVIISDSPTEMRGIGGGYAIEGFQVRDSVAILKWDVPGGMQFID